MKRIFICIAFLWANMLQAQIAVPTPAAGRVERWADFSSQYVASRHIDIWLPPQYDSLSRYPVLYMHDGQMLFDSTITWNHQEWGVDETLERLFRTGAMKPCIVVGIHSVGQLRHAEYFPEKAWNMLSSAEQEKVFGAMRQYGTPVFADTVQSDRYLRFLVEELKPLVDRKYATLPDRAHTWIAGSSMGGLISMYALCEYPAIFGRAACLSTHWPGIFEQENNPIPGALQAYMRKYLPRPGKHRLYFDYGTATLDALYEPHQKVVDGIMREKGYGKKNWMTRKFEGADHSEKAWRERLEIPLIFIGKK